MFTSYGKYVIWKKNITSFWSQQRTRMMWHIVRLYKQFEHYFTLRRLWQQFHQERLTRREDALSFQWFLKFLSVNPDIFSWKKGLVRFFKIAFFREMLAFFKGSAYSHHVVVRIRNCPHHVVVRIRYCPHHVVVRIRYCPHHSLIAKGCCTIELLEQYSMTGISILNCFRYTHPSPWFSQLDDV